MSCLSDKAMRRLIWILLALALFFLAQAFYIPAKAMLAQVLLRQAWAETLASHGKVNKPWPWADTWPVARLIVPAQDIDQIVLAGDTGNSLAFGPGRSVQSSSGPHRGAIMISAHRDTEFHFLKHIASGELIELQDKSGRIRHYRVQHMQIADTLDGDIRVPDDGKWLVLVTCYPFGALLTGGSRRYVVSARAVSNASNSTLPL
ncbi:MAG: class GN sortase [Gammaproteobacteria bacterium]|jgi:sortase A